jgi:metallo-beta-lactamase class B
MGRITRRRVVVVLFVALIPVAVHFIHVWIDGTRNGGQKPAEPFRIAGNFYYVGANDVTSFLITAPEGHILIDGGYPGTPPLIMASIAKLGFNIKDVKIILNSEPHYDHAGGLAELQKVSGAEIWASDDSATAMESGGDPGKSSTFLPYRILVWTGILKYGAPRIDHRLKDGDVVRLGSNELTAHITGGHTRGCTTWTFNVKDHGRELHVVSACSLTLLPGMKLTKPERYPGIKEDFERTFGVLRSLPEDIFVTAHAREFGRYRKYVESTKLVDPVEAFIDHEGYAKYIDDGEAKFRKEMAEQQGH